MNDLIIRQAAIDALLGITAMKNTIPLDSAIFNIKRIPAADVVEVVRCKDCKHLFEDNGCPLRTWWTHLENDFCSYGERREND